jgi:iron complex outermembrane receptor protein
VARQSGAPLASGFLLVSVVVHGADLPALQGNVVNGTPTASEVVITGSRIPTLTAEEMLPVTVLDSTDVSRGGGDSLATLLQTLPMSAASVRNPNINNEGDGSARLDLRALSPKRTLVLLNGRRFPNGGIGADSSVDINSIPIDLIDRVEILTSGASTVYGADAVAGVVNFITKSEIDGLQLGAQQSRSSQGDGQVTKLNVNAGHEFLGGQWMVGGQYVRQREVSQSSRAFSAVPMMVSDLNGDVQAFGSYNTPEGLFEIPEGNVLGLAPGFYTHISGSQGRTASQYREVDFNTDIFNFAPYQYLQTPNERGSLWLQGKQPLSADIVLHLEGLFSHRTSSQRQAPTPYDSGGDPSPLLANGLPGIPASNYYNPFGTDLEAVRRRLVEIQDRGNSQRIDAIREAAALSIQLGAWKVEPSIVYARSYAVETDFGSIPGQKLQTALGPSGLDAQGNIVCGSAGSNGIVPATAVIPGCIPVDVFGGVGSLDSRQIQYLRQTLVDHGTNVQLIAGVDAQGPFGKAWGGPVEWALGAEYRQEQGSYLFDPNRGGGVVGSGGQQDIPRVQFSAREMYLESRAPIMRRRPLVGDLDASAGLRWSDFSSFGGHFTWQTGIRWKPIAPFAFRVSYSQVFRAPALSELYVAQGLGVDSEVDPCGNGPSPTQQAHCAANGVPGGSYVQPSAGTFNVIAGGNPHLAPERGYSVDGGIDWLSQIFSGLHASLDVYQISLTNYIEAPNDEQVLQQCAADGRADVCGLIRRDPDGTISSISSIPRNFGRSLVRGADLAIGFRRDTPVGTVKIKIDTSYLARHDLQLFPGSPILAEAGTYSQYEQALPRWRSLAHLDLDRKWLHLSYSTQWLGGYGECNSVYFSDQIYCRRVPNVFYHDAEAAVSLRALVTLRFGINNIGNRQPPFLNFGNEANTDTSTYRLLGRTFFASLSCYVR